MARELLTEDERTREKADKAALALEAAVVAMQELRAVAPYKWRNAVRQREAAVEEASNWLYRVTHTGPGDR